MPFGGRLTPEGSDGLGNLFISVAAPPPKGGGQPFIWLGQTLQLTLLPGTVRRPRS